MASAVKQRRAYDPYRNIGYAYDGSAARVLDGEEVLQPRPQVRPRRQEIVPAPRSAPGSRNFPDPRWLPAPLVMSPSSPWRALPLWR